MINVSRSITFGPEACRLSGALTFYSKSCFQAKIQYNHYAMPAEISPLQEAARKRKLATITSTAAGEDE